MNIISKIILLVIFLCAPGLTSKTWAQNPETDPLSYEIKNLAYDWAPGQGGALEIKLHLPDGFHAYEEKFTLVILEPDGFNIAPLSIHPLKKWHDKFSKKDKMGMEKDAVLSTHIEAPSRFLKKITKMKMELTYQACSEQFCLFPVTKVIETPISLAHVEGDPQLLNATGAEKEVTSSFFDSSLLKQYLETSSLFGLLLVFLAGIVTSFTPCIFPMIPITLAVLGNHSNERTRLQNFITSCIYVLGIATTYSILGLLAASSGHVFGATLGNPFVLGSICLIFLAMSLSMYGLFEIQIPAYFRNKLGRSKQKQNLAGAYLTGLFAGIVASPCVGPVLVSILTFVASTQNKLIGFFYLFTYALGLGLIFILLGLSNQLIKALPRSGPWMNAVKFILGSLMLGAFYYYLEMLAPPRFFDFSLGLGLIILSSIYGAFLPIQNRSLFDRMRKGTMLAVLIVGIGHVALASFDLRPYLYGRITGNNSINQINKINWQDFSDSALEQAARDQKPVIIDFWAEWCASCHELEEHTFTDARVRALAQGFIMLKFDATKDSQKLHDLKTRFNIQGLPSVIFINRNGMWEDSLSLTQFETPEKFVKRMEKGRL